MRKSILSGLAGAGLALVAAYAGAAPGKPAQPRATAVPRYAHILVIVEENKSFNRIIGSPDAPIITRLAKEYGEATDFFGEVHPSEANYVAMLGGDTFGIHDDDAFYCKPGDTDRYCTKSAKPGYAVHTVTARSLMDQLDERHLTWKGYFEDIPEPGSKIVRYPDPAKPDPGRPPSLYAAKHNGFVTFARIQNDPALASKFVGFDVLARDLASGSVPNYAHIVPNQCNEMHGMDAGPGIPADCSDEPALIQRGDREIGRLVELIQKSPIWKAPDNTAIVITWDEDGKPRNPADPQGCCGYDPKSVANFGGGHIPTVVITNHGGHGIVDPTPYNHYSLLRTTEAAFGIDEYLAHAGDAAMVPMAPLFAVQ